MLALPAVEDLSLASDFSAFLQEEVGEALRRQALKKLFADPHFNRMDGLDIYIDDYSVPDPIPPEVMEKLQHAAEWLAGREAAAPAPEAAAGEHDAGVACGEPAAGAERPATDGGADDRARSGAEDGARVGAAAAGASGRDHDGDEAPAHGLPPPQTKAETKAETPAG